MRTEISMSALLADLRDVFNARADEARGSANKLEEYQKLVTEMDEWVELIQLTETGGKQWEQTKQ